MKTSIIIVNFNGETDTIECLQSLFALKDKNFNIIVVDNSVNDFSIDRVKKWLDHLKPVPTLSSIQTSLVDYEKRAHYYFLLEDDIVNLRSKKIAFDKEVYLIKAQNNNGFAAANNIGLKIVNDYFNSELIWILNNDTVVEKSALKGMIDFMQNRKDVGIAGSVIMEYNSPLLIQSIGGYYNKYKGTISDGLKGNNLSELNTGNKPNIDFPIGASLFVKSEFLTSVGLMCEDYFLYFEEIDWVTRGKKLNWTCDFASKSLVWHKAGASINKNTYQNRSKLSDYFNVRSRLILTVKFFPWALPTIYLSMFILLFNRIKRRQFDRILFIMKICINPNIAIANVYTASMGK